MIGMGLVGSTYRPWGVTSVDIDQPRQQYTKLGGPVTDAGDIVLAPIPVNVLGDVSGTVPYDWNNGWVFSIRLVGATTLTFSNPLNGMSYRILVIQGGAGNFALSFPGAVVWPGAGTNPGINATTGQRTQIELLYDGTNYHGLVNKTANIN